ncbi:hypothetical protein [Thiocystis violacea]|uniref:hypothetical protein n=1 Tax=Thiocystis violacea TaxID=13725 RepID=UPI00190423CD|nr:hypothetical protein [Thiocystis violacea]MBK1720399.1 hypothetical protein [Thiocystis violacea]
MTTTPRPARHDWRSIAALAEIVNAGTKKTTLSEHALRHYVRHAQANAGRARINHCPNTTLAR